MLFSPNPKSERECGNNFRILQNMVRLTLDSFGPDVKLSRYFDSVVGIHPYDAAYSSDCLLCLDLLTHNGVLFTPSSVGKAIDFMNAYRIYYELSFPDVTLKVDLSDPAGYAKMKGTFYRVGDLIEDSNLIREF